MQLYVASLATKTTWEGALQIMIRDWYFLKGFFIEKVVLLAVTYDSSKNQILLPFAIVTSETDDYWL